MRRPATASDFAVVHAMYMHPEVASALGRVIVSSAEFAPVYADLLQRPNLYVYELNNEIVGFYHLSRHADGHRPVAHLSPFVVSPPHQGAGIGRRMLGELIDRARSDGITRLQLFVATINQRASRLYLGAGFAIETTLQGNSAAGASLPDEHLMALVLA